jgi:TPR repeat protein
MPTHPKPPPPKAGHTNAQYNLGVLLATLRDPPELVEACRWLTTAAKAGKTKPSKRGVGYSPSRTSDAAECNLGKVRDGGSADRGLASQAQAGTGRPIHPTRRSRC